MSNNYIFGKPVKQPTVPKKILRERNLEEVIKDCIFQFNQHNRKFVIVYGNPFDYVLFKRKLSEKYHGDLIFMRRFNTVKPEMINGRYGDSRVIIHDAYKKTSPISDLIYFIDLDKVLNLKKFNANI